MGAIHTEPSDARRRVGNSRFSKEFGSKVKKDWVYYMLENYDLATYSKLEGARNFISEVLNYAIK